MFSIKLSVNGKETKNLADDLMSSIKNNLLDQIKQKFEKIETDVYNDPNIEEDVVVQFNVEFSEDMKSIKIQTNSLKDKSVRDALLIALKNNLDNNEGWVKGVIQKMIKDLETKSN